MAMLALAPGQRRHREQVLERLWPDLQPVAAARNLHQTLYVARRALAGSNGGADGLLAIKDELIVLDEAGPVPVDVLRFERLAAGALVSGDEAALRSAAEAVRRRPAARPAVRGLVDRAPGGAAGGQPGRPGQAGVGRCRPDPRRGPAAAVPGPRVGPAARGCGPRADDAARGGRPPLGGAGQVRTAAGRPAGGVRHGPRPADHRGLPRTADRRSPRTTAARTRRPPETPRAPGPDTCRPR